MPLSFAIANDTPELFMCQVCRNVFQFEEKTNRRGNRKLQINKYPHIQFVNTVK